MDPLMRSEPIQILPSLFETRSLRGRSTAGLDKDSWLMCQGK